MSTPKRWPPWWGEYELGVHEIAKWQIGPLQFWLHRGASEWRLAHDWLDKSARNRWDVLRDTELPEGEIGSERFAVSEDGAEVRLRPLAADRSVVARPKTPFRVLAGQRSRVFISSPLWVEIGVGVAPTVLCELPTERLSDTWFGATTLDGELCYALKTNARTSLEEMPRAADRLLTPAVIENRGPDALLVERLNLPVPFLSIYGGEAGEAWSEEVNLLRTEGGNMAELDVLDGPPAEAAGATRLSAARQIPEQGHLFRAFGSLLGFE
jgi:hypothetical protein